MRNKKGQFMKGTKPTHGFTSEWVRENNIGKKWRLGMKNSNKQKEAVRTYMKNRVISKETRKKMSEAGKRADHSYLLGKKIPYKSRPNQVGKYAGSRHHNWKGGITTKDHFERVKFKKTMQKMVLERDNYTCQMCGKRGVDLQVDHVQSWADYVELRFSMDNCRTLCKGCHYQITFGKPIPDKKMEWGHNLGKARITS